MLLLVSGASGVGKPLRGCTRVICSMSTKRPASLELRNEPADLIPLHQGFAAWLRAHAIDPGHVPEAILADAWPAMCWERWVGRTAGPEWAMTVLGASRLAPEQVAAEIADWCRRAVAGEAPVFRADRHLRQS